MKRLLVFAALIVAIGSFGGHITAAHAQTAQTLTPAQTAALQQQLDVAKAELANLQMQAGAVPPADAGTPSTVPPSIAGTGSATAVATTPAAPATPVATNGLSAAQISTFKATLATLAASLTQLAASVSANTTLAPSQMAAVATTLNGMQSTLVAMANTISAANSATAVTSAPTVATNPTSPVAVNSAPSTAVAPNTTSATVAPTKENTPSVAANTTPIANNPVPQVAQASSFWSFTKSHWPTIVIILLVIAILAILFWPEKETVRTVPTGNSGSGKPKSAPTTNVTVTTSQNTVPTPMRSNNSPATPVANAVVAPAQK